MKVDRIIATSDPLSPDRYLVSVFWRTDAGKILDGVIRNDDTSIELLGRLPKHLGCIPTAPECNLSDESNGPRKSKG